MEVATSRVCLLMFASMMYFIHMLAHWLESHQALRFLLKVDSFQVWR